MRPRVVPLVLLATGVLAGCQQDADTHRHFADPTDDVSRVEWPLSGPVEDDLPNVDLVAADLRHTGELVRIVLTYDRLEPRPARGWHVNLYLETSKGREYRVGFSRAQHDGARSWFSGWGIMRFDSESALPSRCDGLAGRPSLPRPRIDRGESTLSIVIPMRCVGRPRWVEVHGLEATLKVISRHTFVDNPFDDSADSDTVVRLTAPRG